MEKEEFERLVKEVLAEWPEGYRLNRAVMGTGRIQNERELTAHWVDPTWTRGRSLTLSHPPRS